MFEDPATQERAQLALHESRQTAAVGEIRSSCEERLQVPGDDLLEERVLRLAAAIGRFASLTRPLRFDGVHPRNRTNVRGRWLRPRRAVPVSPAVAAEAEQLRPEEDGTFDPGSWLPYGERQLGSEDLEDAGELVGFGARREDWE
jgi:hypothetical protein